MTFDQPFWLILVIPLALALTWWRLPTRALFVLRLLSLVLLLLALANLGLRLPSRCGTVVVVADRSLSMPPDSSAAMVEAADLLASAMPSGDRLAVVSFAEKAAIEQLPQGGKFNGFTAEVGREASQLGDGLDLGLSLVGAESPGWIVVLSDGQWTGRDPSGAAARAAAAGVGIDYRTLARAAAGDLAVERIQGPESVAPGESFLITAWLDSPRAQTVSYELRRGDELVARGRQAVAAGTTRLLFRDHVASVGVCEYVLQISGQQPDPVPENNRARLLVGVRGVKPLLCVSADGASGLARLLAKGGMDGVPRPAGKCKWTLEELAGYSAVLLENVPGDRLGHVAMQNLAAWVSHHGGGLMMTGGQQSYGPGGYYKSPLEKILPVSMEMRREHRKLSLAIVVALDRSGSMALPVSGGRAKMDLANLATSEVVEMLGPLDQFGCIAVDSIPHEIVPLADVENKAAMQQRILRIDSAGGGIFIYEALAAAARMIAPAKAGTRHIILFADAADSEEPGNYKDLVEKCVKAGVTISVVGLGTEHDSDAELLKDIARRGGGQCMFTNIAQELPRLFAQDTFLVARSAFLDEPVGVRATGGLLAITRQPLGDFPNIGGYNLCYLRPEANLALVSLDEYQAPVLASWQAGLGRVLCYTGEADGQYTGPMAAWKNAGELFSSLARFAAGKSQGFGPNVVATQELRNGICRVELHLDPARETPPLAALPELSVLAARPGEAAFARKIGMNWSSADILLGEIPLAGDQTVLATLRAPGLGQVALAPMCLPYSSEYLPARRRDGAAALERLARATGGSERLKLADVWSDLPRRPRLISLSPYLLLAAALVFLFEVFHRRTGLGTVKEPFTRLSRRLAQQARSWSRPIFKPRSASPVANDKGKAAEPPLGSLPAAPPSPPAQAETSDATVVGALWAARKRARTRTERRER